MTNARLFSFVAGNRGPWRIVGMDAVAGAPLPQADKLTIQDNGSACAPDAAQWVLRGVTSNERYVKHGEKEKLLAEQAGLGRPASTCAALIPIRKSAAWWSLPQDRRRRIFETRSHHIEIGRKYLPAIARRLLHCRDLGAAEPFDFLTWFEYAPADAPAFDRLVAELRATQEWQYVEREVDIRLLHDSAG